jgi:hypothetical protein
MKANRTVIAAAALLLPAIAYAQSAPPAQLAPGSSGSAIAPQGQAPSSQPRTSGPNAAPGGSTVQAPTTPAPPATTGSQLTGPAASHR